MSNRKLLVLVLAAFVISAVGIARSLSGQAQTPPNANPPQPPSNAAANSGAVARGRYLVEDVAYCTNCHTPHFDNGKLDRSAWLQGGPLFWQPAHTLQNYPQMAPRIAGTLPATDDQMITLLTTGVWKDGTRLREPMPQFRFTREDAQAVLAYLKSLAPVQ